MSRQKDSNGFQSKQYQIQQIVRQHHQIDDQDNGDPNSPRQALPSHQSAQNNQLNQTMTQNNGTTSFFGTNNPNNQFIQKNEKLHQLNQLLEQKEQEKNSIFGNIQKLPPFGSNNNPASSSLSHNTNNNLQQQSHFTFQKEQQGNLINPSSLVNQSQHSANSFIGKRELPYSSANNLSFDRQNNFSDQSTAASIRDRIIPKNPFAGLGSTLGGLGSLSNQNFGQNQNLQQQQRQGPFSQLGTMGNPSAGLLGSLNINQPIRPQFTLSNSPSPIPFGGFGGTLTTAKSPLAMSLNLNQSNNPSMNITPAKPPGYDSLIPPALQVHHGSNNPGSTDPNRPVLKLNGFGLGGAFGGLSGLGALNQQAPQSIQQKNQAFNPTSLLPTKPSPELSMNMLSNNTFNNKGILIVNQNDAKTSVYDQIRQQYQLARQQNDLDAFKKRVQFQNSEEDNELLDEMNMLQRDIHEFSFLYKFKPNTLVLPEESSLNGKQVKNLDPQYIELIIKIATTLKRSKKAIKHFSNNNRITKQNLDALDNCNTLMLSKLKELGIKIQVKRDDLLSAWSEYLAFQEQTEQYMAYIEHFHNKEIAAQKGYFGYEGAQFIKAIPSEFMVSICDYFKNKLAILQKNVIIIKSDFLIQDDFQKEIEQEENDKLNAYNLISQRSTVTSYVGLTQSEDKEEDLYDVLAGLVRYVKIVQQEVDRVNGQIQIFLQKYGIYQEVQGGFQGQQGANGGSYMEKEDIQRHKFKQQIEFLDSVILKSSRKPYLQN